MKTSELKHHYRPSYEPDDARLCVAPTIWDCFTAIDPFAYDRCYIYRTGMVSALNPADVGDARITHERWVVEPCWMTLAIIVESREWAAIVTSIMSGCSLGSGKKRPYFRHLIQANALRRAFRECREFPKVWERSTVLKITGFTEWEELTPSKVLFPPFDQQVL